MKAIKISSLIILTLVLSTSCSNSRETEDKTSSDPEAEVVRKKRDDGTLSSVNQVDEMGRVHGLRITYFEDGKTIHSKLAFNHGIKQGPSIRYYRNGQIFEHSSFENGKKHGISRKYHKDGTLLSECEFKDGHAKPGLKEYKPDGTLITSYPEVEFREMNHLADRNRIDLELSCKSKVNGVKYFVLNTENGQISRTYLISEKSASTMQYYVKPGEILNKQITILAEIPTELGNIYARELKYKLLVSNTK